MTHGNEIARDESRAAGPRRHRPVRRQARRPAAPRGDRRPDLSRHRPRGRRPPRSDAGRPLELQRHACPRRPRPVRRPQRRRQVLQPATAREPAKRLHRRELPARRPAAVDKTRLWGSESVLRVRIRVKTTQTRVQGRQWGNPRRGIATSGMAAFRGRTGYSRAAHRNGSGPAGEQPPRDTWVTVTDGRPGGSGEHHLRAARHGPGAVAS